MRFFDKMIKPYELDQIFSQEVENTDGIPIGQLESYDTEKAKNLFRLWCKRIDKIVQMDKEVNGLSKIGHTANYWRAFTFEEYFDLFNKSIKEEDGDFAFYPIFNQLERDSGGIVFEKQRERFTSRYEYNEEDYIKILCENGFEEILNFFFNKYKSLAVRLPKAMMSAHTYIFGATRSGKSNLLRHIIHRILDLWRDHSMIILDAHGQLAKQVYRSVLFRQKRRVVYFSTNFKEGYTPTINFFETPSKDRAALIHAADNILSVFSSLLKGDEKLTIPQKAMLQKCVNYVLRRNDSSMDILMRLLACDAEIVENACLYDPDYFSERFQAKTKDRVREALLSKLEMIYDNEGIGPLIKGRSTINLEKIINTRSKVIIFDLSGLAKGFSRTAFGKMVLAYIQNIVVKRDADDPDLVPCYLVIDEAQTFADETYGELLAEMSKFGVRMILANQFVNQLGRQTEDVQRNTAVKIGSGHYSEDFKGMMKIPKRFQIDSKTENGKVNLSQYEFFVDVRFRNMLKVKSPYFLEQKRYKLTEAELEELNEYQLEHYYKPIGEPDRTSKSINTGFRRAKIENIEKKAKSQTKPPFNLYLGEDDTTV